MPLKVLNLYAGIGGNRKLWIDVEVTAVEIVPEIAAVYHNFFPQDIVIVGDAHTYLLEHYKEFDFIWSSPPCQSHSKIRKNSLVARGDGEPLYPDMSLYQEVLLLKNWFKGKWVVENVIGYYEPLIKPQVCGKHYFWANFNVSEIPKLSDGGIRMHNKPISLLQSRKGFDLKGIHLGHRKDQILHNCTEPNLGLHIFNCAFKTKQEVLS